MPTRLARPFRAATTFWYCAFHPGRWPGAGIGRPYRGHEKMSGLAGSDENQTPGSLPGRSRLTRSPLLTRWRMVCEQRCAAYASTWSPSRSAQLEILQVVETDLDGLERASVTAVLLNEDVLGTGLGRASKDLRPINATLANRRERVGPAIVGEVGGTGREARLEILDMEQGKAPRVLLEVVERVPARVGCPEDVHLHFQEFGVAAHQHDVIAAGVAQGRKLTVVRMVAKLHAGALSEPA